ncbi:MAG: ROK family protein [Actinomycetota bacterium]
MSDTVTPGSTADADTGIGAGASADESAAMTAGAPTAPDGDGERVDEQARRPEAADVVLAVDVDGARFSAGLVNPRGELIDRSRVDVDPDAGPESHYTGVAAVCADMLDAAERRSGTRVVAVGVGVDGPLDDLNAVSPASLPAWREFPLRRRLSELTGARVYGDVDARVLALAEGWRGAAQGHTNFCAITVSATVAGGIVLDDDLLDGGAGSGGNIGHVVVVPGGRRCRCGAQGCLDAEASGLAIEAITGRPPSEPTYEIMQRTGRLVGRAAASVCNALDLSLVVVGGSVAAGFAATFFHAAQTELDERAHQPYSTGARITPSRLGETGPLIGAGAIGWRGARRARRRGPARRGA